jgi:hypothetical protein
LISKQVKLLSVVSRAPYLKVAQFVSFFWKSSLFAIFCLIASFDISHLS